MTQPLEQKIDVETYLELEKSSEVRHEYVDGELLAMAGEKLQHNDIVANILEVLRPIARTKKMPNSVRDGQASRQKHEVSLPGCDGQLRSGN
jgi:Uma2 family endonuclease